LILKIAYEWTNPVFRREPLWKVSMNVRMHPTVRCTYEAEENVVRLILQELVEQPNIAQEDRNKEIVVYALKVCSFTL
jgi:hypothetical protein